MKQKLLRAEDYPPRCAHCAFGVTVEGDVEVLCRRNGVMQPDDCCGEYLYDPLKRKPKRQKIEADFKPEDFAL